MPAKGFDLPAKRHGNMIPILLGLIVLATLVVLFRLLWLSAQPRKKTVIITLATLALVVALAALAATGRLHWLAAAGTALLPFLRRGLELVMRLLPFAGRFFTGFRQRASSGAAQAGAMTQQQALNVLGLGSNPSRQEIVEAHRRLMAKNHPDKGGSTFIAQQLNEARKTLLA